MKIAVILFLVVVTLLGSIMLDEWAKKRAAKKRVEETLRAIDEEEALFQNNLQNLWTRPEDENEQKTDD